MKKYRVLTGFFWCAATLLSGVVASAAETSQFIANNTSKLVTTAKDLGLANQNQIIDVSIWLKLPNREGLDSLAQELYNPKSPQYRQWLSPAQIKAQFSPTNAEVAAIKQFFSSRSLPVTAVGPGNLYVSAKGTIAAVSSAFNVAIHNFQLKGNTYFANTSDPRIDDPAASSVAAVHGLTNLAYTHPLETRTAPKQTPGGNTSVTANADPSFFISNCFNTTGTETFTTNGSYPIATYKGNIYAANGGEVGCGYTPPEIHQAYGLNTLYSGGVDGAGQTIVIIDWCGSPTIQSDANAFSARFGLPPLTSSNFRILYSSTTPTCAGPDPEINIDVEWAHAIAPGANIDLVVPPSASFQDVDFAEAYAVLYDLGNVISGSYGSPELYLPISLLQTTNLLNELAAVAGISANFSTGDYGDFTVLYGFPPTVSAPADSPYATAVGGISLALNASNAIQWQTGWGTNLNILVSSGYVLDPPNISFFDFGSGGGPSAYFGKPSWQKSLSGTSRQLPDISWLADPYTGGVIAISEPLQSPPLIWTVYGGTSLACPMFSALWAIANEEAGTPLGQAAPYLYSMPADTITDILPVSSPTNVTGTINQGGGVVDHYSASYLAQPLENTTVFYSALWNIPLYQDTTYLITFGTDSSLTITKGWDNVTGLGVPNPTPFAMYFSPAKP